MLRIVASIITLEHHFQALEQTPDPYRPAACPHCGAGRVWRHSHYLRKADRRAGCRASRNPVPIRRYVCAHCRHTCSRLPLCIAPRRWHDWTVQEAALSPCLDGASLRQSSRLTGIPRRTVRRWWQWLDKRSTAFAFFLRSRFPDLGKSADGPPFWRQVLARFALGPAMAWLDRDLDVP